MTQPNQSELYQALTDICFENGGVTKTMVDKLTAYITANYTPINQPSTKITPVTDGVGGSESTNQSEHKEVK